MGGSTTNQTMLINHGTSKSWEPILRTPPTDLEAEQPGPPRGKASSPQK